jgi:S1-C subfamily serine protease
MYRKIAAAVSATGLVLAIGACGGSGDSGPKSQQEVAADSQPAVQLLIGTYPGDSPGATRYTCSTWSDKALGNDLVVTDAHCVTAPNISVGGTPAHIVGVDNAHDIAVLSVPGSSAKGTLALAPATEKPVIGDTVYTLGYPSNGTETDAPYQVTAGDVSAVAGVTLQVNDDEFEQIWDQNEMVNDNAPITLSNLTQSTSDTTAGGSGGPVLNEQGQVVGMTETGTGEASQNDATSLETLRAALPGLAAGTHVAYTGITMSAVPTQYVIAQQKTGLNDPGFAFVYSVQPDSPADQQTNLSRYLRQTAGKYGTYIAVDSINGQEFTTQQDIVNQLSTLAKGQQVRMHAFETALDPHGFYQDLGTYRFTLP